MHHRIARSLPIAPALLLLAGPATARQDDLPKAEEILAKYVEATGGREAYEKLTNRKVVGTVEVPAQGLGGEVETYEAAPGKSLAKITFEGLGSIVAGTNDGVAWEVNPLTGDRLYEGAEKADALRRGTFNDDLKYDELYEEVRTVGEEDVDGTACFVVELVPAEGSTTTEYFAKDSGLLLKSVSTITNPMGEIEAVSMPSDYREVDGIKIPFKIVETADVIEFVTTVESVEHNVEIPEGTFEVPAALKDQIDDDGDGR